MQFSHVSAISFGKESKGKLQKTDRLFTPGPGTYSPGLSKRSAPKWKLGTESRSKSVGRFQVPGPGQYEAKGKVGEAPKYSMASKSGIDTSKYVVSPGPGIYSPKYNYMNRNLSYSMSARHNLSKTLDTPGPGNYNIRVDKSLQVPTYKFGTEKKNGLVATESKYVPGPGNYQTTETIGKSAPKFSFGKEMRGDKGRPFTPGPGTYEYKNYVGKDAPRISMSSRPKTAMSQSSYVPGPGAYDNTALIGRTKSPSYRIGSAKRDGGFRHSEAIPGPGTYTPVEKTASIRPKSPTWSMGTGTRKEFNPTELVPGPGNYNVRVNPGQGPKYTLTGKNLYSGSKGGVPGPGQYNSTSLTHLYKNPSWKIGTSSRDDNLKKVIKEGLPGPGNYSLRAEKSMPSFKFGTEKREWIKVNDTPGPGQYRVPCTIADVPNFSRSNGFDNNFRFI